MKVLLPRVKRLFQKGIVKNVSVLVGGTAFSQLIGLLALPLLTKLFSPEDFAVLAVFTSIVTLISVVSCLRFEIAIPMPKEEHDAVALFVLALASVGLVTSLTIIGLWFFSEQIKIATEGKLVGYIWLIPLGVVMSGLYGALQYWATRHKAFNLVARTRMAQALSGSGAQLSLGFFGIAPLGLLIGFIFSTGAGVLGLTRYFINEYLTILKSIKLGHLKKVFHKYSHFPRYSTFEAFANTGSIQVPVILVAYYTIGAEAGFLMLAMRLLSTPLGLIGRAVAQVYLSEAAEKHHQGQLKEFTHKAVLSLIKIGVLPLFVAAVMAPFAVPFIFGEEWKRTGVLITWMAPWFFMQLITSPVSMALHITGNQKIAFTLQVFGLLFRVGSVFLAALYFNDFVSEVYAVSGFIFYIVFLRVVLLVINKKNLNCSNSL